MSLAPPAERLYHSDRVYGFQGEGSARVYIDTSRPDLQAKLALWSTGIGKTHLAMISAALMFEDDLIDLVLTIAEPGKVLDWIEDWKKFTELSVDRYHGDIKRRAKLRANMPQVLVSTVETVKADAVVFQRKPKGKIDPRKKPDHGPLVESLKGKRVFVIYDEMSAKLGADRTSGNYVAHFWFINFLRQIGAARALGLTANPFSKDIEGTFNISRILLPKPPCTVAEFEERYVAYRDERTGKIKKTKNITPDFCAPDVIPFTTMLAPLVMVKLKTDADVRDEFPKQVEESEHVVLSDEHYDFYERIEGFFNDLPEDQQRVGWSVLRQIAGHPMSLLTSKGKYAQEIVKIVGAQKLAAMGSKKTDRFMDYLVKRSQAGEQVVAFTFFGQSILPLLEQEIRAKGISLSINHGQMSQEARQEQKARFRGGETEVFLTSDAGARGLNLPEALVVVNYEFPPTWALYDQRINRANRIDSRHASVTCMSFVSSFTVEDALADMVMKGNESEDELIQQWNKTLLEDDDDGAGAIPPHLRRRMLNVARGRRERK